MNKELSKKITSIFENLLSGFCILQLVALALVVILAVFFRKFGQSFIWYDEVASVQLAWITYYGAAYCALKRSHLGFNGFVDNLNDKLRKMKLSFVVFLLSLLMQDIKYYQCYMRKIL